MKSLLAALVLLAGLAPAYAALPEETPEAQQKQAVTAFASMTLREQAVACYAAYSNALRHYADPRNEDEAKSFRNIQDKVSLDAVLFLDQAGTQVAQDLPSYRTRFSGMVAAEGIRERCSAIAQRVAQGLADAHWALVEHEATALWLRIKVRKTLDSGSALSPLGPRQQAAVCAMVYGRAAERAAGQPEAPGHAARQALLEKVAEGIPAADRADIPGLAQRQEASRNPVALCSLVYSIVEKKMPQAQR